MFYNVILLSEYIKLSLCQRTLVKSVLAILKLRTRLQNSDRTKVFHLTSRLAACLSKTVSIVRA